MNWKLIGIGVGAVLGALVLAAVLFFVFFPKDLAAREAERRIEEATGRELTLGENISVSFWPALGFSVDNAALSNPEGFAQTEPFIAADRIVFAVRVLPLLRGAVEVKQLIFEGADVHMKAKEDGSANWTFPTEQTPDQQATLEDLRLDDVRLVDGTISFQGAEGGEPFLLEDVDASLALESLDAPATVQAALTYRGERMNIAGEIGLPRAVLEKTESPLSAQVSAAPLNAGFNGSFNSATGALVGALEAEGQSLRRLAAWMGSPLGEGGGFGAYRLTGQMAHEGQVTRLTETVIRLDNIDARGNLTLTTRENGRLHVGGALSSATLDLNPYLPAPAQGAAEGGVEVDTAWPATPLDLSGLRALDANLDLTLGALRFQRMSFSNVALGLRIANGAADARLTRISLYEGAGTARLIVDGASAAPRIAVELNADSVQAEPLLRDAIGFDRIAGRGRLTASLAGQGRSQAEIMRSLRGNASFSFNDGQWKGVNLAQVARTVQAALSGEAVGQAAATDFAELSATFGVDGGVMATDNLRLLNPFVRLDGQGMIDVGTQRIDMRIAPRAVRSIQGQGGDASASGIGIPFRVSGPWSRVSFQPALGDVVQNELRSRAQDILRNQPRGSALGQLGDVLFGPQPASQEAPAEGAEPPTEEQTPSQAEERPPQTTEQRARDALGGLLRDALGSNRDKQEPPPEPAPAPTP